MLLTLKMFYTNIQQLYMLLIYICIKNKFELTDKFFKTNIIIYLYSLTESIYIYSFLVIYLMNLETKNLKVEFSFCRLIRNSQSRDSCTCWSLSLLTCKK